MKVLRAKAVNLADLLPEDVMASILKAGVVKSYSDGQVIQERGDTQKSISIVKSGLVVAGNIDPDGTFLASSLLYPGESFGEFTLFAGLPRSHSLWAQGPTQITHVSGQRFLTLFDREPSIPRALLTITLLRTHEILGYLDDQRRLSMPARLARLLANAVGNEAADATVDCRHEDLAFMLGVSRVSVGKALKRLEAGGLVALEYGRIRIPDVAALRDRIELEI